MNEARIGDRGILGALWKCMDVKIPEWGSCVERDFWLMLTFEVGDSGAEEIEDVTRSS
jgi:hypothetical protein